MTSYLKPSTNVTSSAHREKKLRNSKVLILFMGESKRRVFLGHCSLQICAAAESAVHSGLICAQFPVAEVESKHKRKADS
jgi:hypothetical protein